MRGIYSDGHDYFFTKNNLHSWVSIRPHMLHFNGNHQRRWTTGEASFSNKLSFLIPEEFIVEV